MSDNPTIPVVKISKEIDQEWVDAVLTTAFDGVYGPSWAWFQGAADTFVDSYTPPENCTIAMRHWVERVDNGNAVGILVRVYAETGKAVLDNSTGWIIDGEAIANAMQKIVDDAGAARARGVRHDLLLALTEDDTGMIDADVADEIVQVASFGEVIFS